MRDGIPAPLPTSQLNLHFLSDTHVMAGGLGTTPLRKTKFAYDCAYGNLPVVDARIHCGDFSNDTGAAWPALANAGVDDAAAVAFMNTLLRNDGTLPPWYAITGNHDIWNSYGASSGRGSTTALQAYGYPSGTVPTTGPFANVINRSGPNYCVDFGVIQGIFLSPGVLSTNNGRMNVDTAALAYMTTQLDAATKDCFIVFHAPLNNTVVDSITATLPATTYDSVTTDFFAYGPNNTDSSEILAALNTRPKARLWLSGHTHNDPRYANMVGLKSCGSRNITFAATPGAYFTAPTVDGFDSLWGWFLTVTRNGVWELRLRNHSQMAWSPINPITGTSAKVWTVA